MKKNSVSIFTPFRCKNHIAAWGAFVLLAVFAIWGCQKNDLKVEDNTKSLPVKVPSCTEAQPTTETVLELMINPDDADDTRMNYVLYHYAQAVRKAMANPTKRCQLVNAMLALEGNGEISLFEYAAENISFGNDLNSDIRQSISEENVYPKGVEQGIDALLADPSFDANTYLRNKFMYEQIDYDPVAHFVRMPEACQATAPVVVVIGTDVNDCDDVAGWRGNDEILMGEGEANSTTEIVIYVGVGERGNVGVSSILIDVEDTFLSSSEPSAVESHIDIDVDRFQIKKRFDHSKKSEVFGYWSNFDPSTISTVSFDFGDAADFDPYKVHKDDIGPNGKMHTDNKDWTNNWPSIFASVQTGAFEKDWYSTAKLLDNSCVEHNVYDLAGKRKYTSDVYFNACRVTLNNWFPTVGSFEDFSNDNCFFSFIRVM